MKNKWHQILRTSPVARHILACGGLLSAGYFAAFFTWARTAPDSTALLSGGAGLLGLCLCETVLGAIFADTVCRYDCSE